MSRAGGRAILAQPAAHPAGRVRDAGVAQVAWETCGPHVLVVAVLRYSRAMWAELVEAPTVGWLALTLLEGARYFGGSPRRWWLEYPDCWAVGQERGSLEWRFAPPLPQLARHLSSALGVWMPRGRGLAEAALDYLAWAFVMKRMCRRRSEANRALRAFLDDTAQRRPHPRLPGRSIAEVLAEERGYLRPLPATLDELGAVLRRGVRDDAGG
jgi:hypothetical protein